MGLRSSSHKVTITPNRWHIEALAAAGRQIANQARSRGVLSQTGSTSTSPTFSQGVLPAVALLSPTRAPLGLAHSLKRPLVWDHAEPPGSGVASDHGALLYLGQALGRHLPRRST